MGSNVSDLICGCLNADVLHTPVHVSRWLEICVHRPGSTSVQDACTQEQAWFICSFLLEAEVGSGGQGPVFSGPQGVCSAHAEGMRQTAARPSLLWVGSGAPSSQHFMEATGVAVRSQKDQSRSVRVLATIELCKISQSQSPERPEQHCCGPFHKQIT